MTQDQIDIYRVGTEVMVNNTKMLIEKVIIGDNNSVTYQTVCYFPERHQLQINAFEISPIMEKTQKQPIGFNSSAEKPEVKVFVDMDNKLLGIDEHVAVEHVIYQLNKDEIREMETQIGEINPKEKYETKKRTKKK